MPGWQGTLAEITLCTTSCLLLRASRCVTDLIVKQLPIDGSSAHRADASSNACNFWNHSRVFSVILGGRGIAIVFERLGSTCGTPRHPLPWFVTVRTAGVAKMANAEVSQASGRKLLRVDARSSLPPHSRPLCANSRRSTLDRTPRRIPPPAGPHLGSLRARCAERILKSLVRPPAVCVTPRVGPSVPALCVLSSIGWAGAPTYLTERAMGIKLRVHRAGIAPCFGLDSSNLPTGSAPTPPRPPTAASPRPSFAGTSDRREWLSETGRARSGTGS